MAFFFAYTQVRTNAQNLGFTCAISFCLNIYYGTLYAYTPEVLPSAHRGTGNGVSIALNRIMGIVSAGVAAYVLWSLSRFGRPEITRHALTLSQRCQYGYTSSHLLVCSIVHCDGGGGGRVSLRTHGQAKFLRCLGLLEECQWV